MSHEIYDRFYDKFTEISLSQQSTSDSVKYLREKVESLYSSFMQCEARIMQLENIMTKQSALMSSYTKVAYTVFIAVCVSSSLIFNDTFRGDFLKDVISIFKQII